MTLLGALKRKYTDAHIMGHRDIWGKNPKNWKKQCPCFDAEAEYGFLDDGGKVEQAKNDESDKYFSPLMSNTPSKLERIIDKIKKLTPWGK